jgi:hypothetical protein
MLVCIYKHTACARQVYHGCSFTLIPRVIGRSGGTNSSVGATQYCTIAPAAHGPARLSCHGVSLSPAAHRISRPRP